MFLGLTLLAACATIGPGSGPSTVQTQPPAITQPSTAMVITTRPPTPQPTLRAKVGIAFTYSDGWKVTALRWQEQAPTNSFLTPNPGNRLVAVFVRFDNGTTTVGHFNPFDFQLQDAVGVRRTVAFASVRNDSLHSGDLAPGAFVSGSVVFEAPVGDQRLELVYQSSPYQQATWELY